MSRNGAPLDEEDLLFADLVVPPEGREPVYSRGPLPARRRATVGFPRELQGDDLRLLLGTVPLWWRRRARAAGLSGRWLDVANAVACPTPAAVLFSTSGIEPRALDLTPHSLVHAITAGVDGASAAALACTFAGGSACIFAVPAQQVSGTVLETASGAVDAAAIGLEDLDEIEGRADDDPLVCWVASVALAAEMLPLMLRICPAQRVCLPAIAFAGWTAEV